MARDEVGTLARLKACRVIIDELIASHRGRIFNTRRTLSSGWAYMPGARWQRTEAIDPASTSRRTAAGAEFLALED
jgi:hypothetical protein